jgi:hypothetical protein
MWAVISKFLQHSLIICAYSFSKISVMYQQIYNNGHKLSIRFSVKITSIYDLFFKVVSLLQDSKPEFAK